MYLTSYGRNAVPLNQVLFSAAEFGDDAKVMLSTPSAQMFVSIGPARDPMAATAPDLSNQIMLIARIVAAEPDAAPADLNVSYSTRTLNLGETPEPKDTTFSVREQVVKDLRALEAWDKTGAKAREFAALTAQDGWDQAVARFDKLYGEQAKNDPNDPNVFRLDRRMNAQRIPSTDLQVLAAQIANGPASEIYMNEARMESRFIDRLYSLAPADANAAPQKPQIMEFKPGRTYYVLKDISVRPVNQEQFQKMKGMVMGREEYSQAQSLAIVHLNPENILKRMAFRWVDHEDESAESETKKESKEAS
jgi:hypothetical protein